MYNVSMDTIVRRKVGNWEVAAWGEGVNTMEKTVTLGPLSDDSSRKMVARIILDTTLADSMMALAEGNPGAITALGELIKDNDEAFIDLCHLDDMRVYGPDIWIGYKDICNFEIEEFRTKIRTRTLKKEIDAKHA